jgi:hypothetical protein
MGVTPLLVFVAAAAIALLLSVFPFRVAPEAVQRLFFHANGRWKSFGRAAWFCALATSLILALWATPRPGP